MSASEREDFVLAAMDALNAQPELMSEGRPHSRSRSRIAALLSDHFLRSRRAVYLSAWRVDLEQPC